MELVYVISLLYNSRSQVVSGGTESICFHSTTAEAQSNQPVRGPVGKAGPIGPAGPPGLPGQDAVCNYDSTEFDAIKLKIDELEKNRHRDIQMRDASAHSG